MSQLYPLLLQPEFHERVWGSRDLAPIFDRKITGAPVGEAWLTGDECRVANGPLAGRSLGQLSREFQAEFLGKAAKGAARFPLLIKFLFPKEKLSVQVHPDDRQAALIGEPCGKTECWYILHADQGAQVALGLRRGVSRGELETAIRENRAEEALNWVDVHAGDLIYVEAGTVHAIGPGAVIVETQQNSDVTYRLYDYGRPRELHIEKGLQAAREQTRAGKVVRTDGESQPGKQQVNLVSSPCFVIDRMILESPWEFRRPAGEPSSVWCLVALEGGASIEASGSAAVTLKKGDAAVIPASVSSVVIRPDSRIEFLAASVPANAVGEPKTALFETIAGSVR